MELWLIIIILSYFAFALASLGDKIVVGQAGRPRALTFYVGVLNILAIFIIPFIDFDTPTLYTALWIVLDGIIYIFGIYGMFSALDKYDVSRVIPAIGAAQPIFIFGFTWLFWGQQYLTSQQILAFVLLLAGTILITLDRVGDLFTKESLKISLATALLFSLDFVFSKFVFLEMPFWQGFIWLRMASALAAMLLLFNRNFYKEVFESPPLSKGSIGFIFILFQGAGGLASVLQSWAIALTPVAYLAIINAIRGVQYVFLFIFTLIFTIYFPKILREDISKGVLIQKIVSIIIIGIGLSLLVQ
ncbi:MAG TPA: EamA family transporter [Candidatus Pacearchaeota archaeon]|jgi:drug/metabolite transporter (DMT)-like permease|nr:EamA family transporter [Candidatus Pacearchaeota archaeon]HRR94695.1 EamA family transporter [Candidatus Paceibacterota bacterium]HPC30375.1 EamA family transporter [Candidatus Pacearchaeota archaeon]HQG09188.1 EamA family transporter [Candidatus Pacearchaeota archaeon]HQH20244.1 EamA family transporter [Candidatus Pacearchaeota archaeon]